MSKLCITTVCSPDRFSFYAPILIYSALKAYPEYFVKIFVRGKLPEDVRKILKEIKFNNYKIIEDFFLDCPTRPSTCNALRHLLPAEEFKDFGYVFITDIDFIYVRNNPSLKEYFSKIMEKTRMPYAAPRGPFKKPYRKNISKIGWKDKFTRIAEGTLMLKTPEWYERTAEVRKYYEDIIRTGLHDSFDLHPSASYREYGEVMLYRICRLCGLKTSKYKSRFLNKEFMSPVYRQIHMGDFKSGFEKRFKRLRRMKRLLPPINLKNFAELEGDGDWIKIAELVSQKDKSIAEQLMRIRKHAKARLA